MVETKLAQEENALFERVQLHNDVDAFRELYARYKRRIMAYCLQIVKDDEAARDAFQNTFAAVYEKRAQYRPGEFSKWLFSIAKRQSMRVYSVKLAHRVPEGFEPEQLEEMPESSPVGESDVIVLDALNAAIHDLTPDFRNALTLRYFEDLPYEEIAKRLNISLALAKVRVNRAKQQLQKAMHLKSEDVI